MPARALRDHNAARITKRCESAQAFDERPVKLVYNNPSDLHWCRTQQRNHQSDQVLNLHGALQQLYRSTSALGQLFRLTFKKMTQGARIS